MIKDAASVAAYLSGLFPNIDLIYSWRLMTRRPSGVTLEEAKQYQARWGEVAHLIPIFANIRRVERDKTDTRGNCVA